MPGLQWAIVVRAEHPVTPPGLALDLGHSAAGTATEVFRMVSMGLLTVSGALAGKPGRGRPGSSFIRALAGEVAAARPGPLQVSVRRGTDEGQR